MAKRPKPPETEPEPQDDTGVVVEPNDQPDGLDMLAGRGKVRVWRINRDGRRAIITTMDRDDVASDVEILGKRYGWGDYILEVYNEKGQYEARHSISFDQENYPRPSERGAPVSGGGSVTESIDRLVESQEKQQASIVAIMQGGNQQLLTMLQAMMQQSNQTLQAFAQAFGNKAAQPQADVLDRVEKLASILRSGKPEPMPMEALMAAINQGMELGERAAGSADPDASPLKQLLPYLLQYINRPTGRPPPTVTPGGGVATDPPAVPVGTSPHSLPGAAAPALPPAPAPASPNGDPIVAAVKADGLYQYFVPTLIRMAQGNIDPKQAAQSVLGGVGPAYLDKMEALKGDQDIADFLSRFEPAVKEHAEWFRAVYAAMDESVPEPPAEPAAAGADGASGA